MKILELLTRQRKIGNFGEKSAAEYLKKQGYRIRERNYVAFDHEVDLICERSDVLAFIEVKTRTEGRRDPREPRPASAVTPQKQRAILSVARAYLATHPADRHVRFDVVEVYLVGGAPTPTVARICHIPGAFTADTAYRRR